MRVCRATAGRLAAMLAAVVLIAGCGGGPSPGAWATSVCSALTPWRAEIRKLTSSTDQQMTAQTSPAQAKENLVRLFDGAARASETARRRVEQAGVPDAEQGAEVSARIRAALAQMRDAYAKARDSIDSLSTSQSTAFYDGVRDAVQTLNQEYEASALDASNLNSKELTRAFTEVPECR
ncbi:hypothetical protein [Salinispora sp. H7-4]|uniref:hypothetical protein n=1 Tax=Salinispora sp. H7-4 TaxID=2748321 RepID=UPI0015D3249E|nr:hypothetical protein [Salinispora sp. H7-4]NYT93185.1 hypothetical protein [Salinispora sp. H7-4]